jgi:hypothetical protein
MAHRSSVSRRAMLGLAVIVPVGGCTAYDKMTGSLSTMFSPPRSTPSASRGERMARMIQNEGRDAMMAPDALKYMGLANQGGRDTPAKLIGQEGPDGRYVAVLITMRGYKEFIFHRKQDDVLMMHHTDLAFRRLETVRYPHYGTITVVTDTVLADNDLQQQLAFWYERLPGR